MANRQNMLLAVIAAFGELFRTNPKKATIILIAFALAIAAVILLSGDSSSLAPLNLMAPAAGTYQPEVHISGTKTVLPARKAAPVTTQPSP